MPYGEPWPSDYESGPDDPGLDTEAEMAQVEAEMVLQKRCFYCRGGRSMCTCATDCGARGFHNCGASVSRYDSAGP